jgi:hypothetical protein
MISKHVFYAGKSIPPLPKLEDLENIPFMNILSKQQSCLSLYENVCKSKDSVHIFNKHGQKLFDFRKTPHAEGLFKYLDGNKSTREIFDAILASPAARKTRPTYQHLLREFREIFDALSVHSLIFLRDPAITAFKTPAEMQKRVTQLYT